MKTSVLTMLWRYMIFAIWLTCLFSAIPQIASAQESPENLNSSDKAKSLEVPERLPLIKMKVVRRRGEHKGYSVHVRYPQFSGGSRSAIRKLNEEVKLVVDRNIPASPAPLGASRSYEYSSDFTKSFATPRVVSLNFEFSDYLGGVHDQKRVASLNAQVYPQFKLLKLKDILGRRVKYKQLSELCLKELPAGWKQDQLGPEELSNFTFDTGGLTFRFSQGEIGAEALECPSATISYQKLNRLIGKDSAIRDLILASTNTKNHSCRQ